MKQILDDVELAKKLGAAGHKNIIENFNLEKHIVILQSVLMDAVAGV